MNEIERLYAEYMGGGLSGKLIMCALLVVLGYVLHKLSKWWIVKSFDRRENDLNSKKINTLVAFVLSIVKYTVYVLIFYSVCKTLQLPIDSLFVAVAGAGGVAIGLGAQSLIKNVINGFFILMEEQYSVGDIVSVGSYTGVVIEIGMRTTKIRSADGSLHIIPNGEISVATNMTRSVYPSYIDINLPYEANAESVTAALAEELASCGEIDGLLNPPKVLGISAFGQYCYTVKILAECEQSKYSAVERALRMIIMKRLERDNVPMPAYPPAADRTG